MTVDTTHTIATNRMTREAFYVALTRGTTSNHAYITTDSPAQAESHIAFTPTGSSRAAVLSAILAHQGAEQSAHAIQACLSRRREPSPRRPAAILQR